MFFPHTWSKLIMKELDVPWNAQMWDKHGHFVQAYGIEHDPIDSEADIWNSDKVRAVASSLRIHHGRKFHRMCNYLQSIAILHRNWPHSNL